MQNAPNKFCLEAKVSRNNHPPGWWTVQGWKTFLTTSNRLSPWWGRSLKKEFNLRSWKWSYLLSRVLIYLSFGLTTVLSFCDCKYHNIFTTSTKCYTQLPFTVSYCILYSSIPSCSLLVLINWMYLASTPHNRVHIPPHNQLVETLHPFFVLDDMKNNHFLYNEIRCACP